LEDRYYSAKHHGLLELGLMPYFMTDEVVVEMLEQVIANKDQIDESKIMPRVSWR